MKPASILISAKALLGLCQMSSGVHAQDQSWPPVGVWTTTLVLNGPRGAICSSSLSELVWRCLAGKVVCAGITASDV